MKKFTHALIACKAVERLYLAKDRMPAENQRFADFLFDFFMKHKQDVIQGAWYPDKIFADMSTSHVYKYKPVKAAVEALAAEAASLGTIANTPLPSIFRTLPGTSLQFAIGKKSSLYLHSIPYVINPNDNLPERCDAISHSVVDNLRVRHAEAPDSPVTVSDKHIALVLFILSHYVADAHMPLHCDDRKAEFLGFDIHDAAEECWNKEVIRYYKVVDHETFEFDQTTGFPRLYADGSYPNSILKAVEDKLANRAFPIGYGTGNDNVREYIQAISQYSYLNAYTWLPYGVKRAELDRETLQTASGMSFREMSVAALADAIDAVARVWLHDLRRFLCWTDAVEPK